ncbi:MAG: hypothetical protein K0Q83_3065, partial [Deltaproteobacteria bacterium]|nr:hypothetical protein [Deltaproteobacteria bacterium]
CEAKIEIERVNRNTRVRSFHLVLA